MTARDPWVQVKDEGELREGMSVQARPCLACGRSKCTATILKEEPSSPCGNCNRVTRTFVTAPACDGVDEGACLAMSIETGRLYRLADDQLTDLSETRELENVR